jgi:hypothetical protein
MDFILDMEHSLVDFINSTEKFFDETDKDSMFNRLKFLLVEIQNNKLFSTLNEMYTLSGTGIPSNKIVSGITNDTVKNAFLLGGTIIGSFFGPLGSIAGGAIGGMLGALFSYPISKAFMSNLTADQKLQMADTIHQINSKYDLGVMNVKKNRTTYKDKLKDEIEKLKKELKDKNL